MRPSRNRPLNRERPPVKKDLWATARLILVGAVLLIVVSRVPPQSLKAFGQGKSDGFDYYVLALSWSPGFCATHDDPRQCSGDEGFVLHGLWPEYEGKGYPTACGAGPLTDTVKRRYTALYPSPTLIDHEWSKHGTCSGLDPDGYFQLTQRIRTKVIIPAAYALPRPVAATQADNVRKAFRQANPGLPADGIRVISAGQLLSEVRICVTPEGAFRTCN